VNSSRPTGSVGSCTDPPRLSLTWRRVRSSTMVRTSGRKRARRSSLVTTRVSAARQAASASQRPGRSRLVPGQTRVDVGPLRPHTQSGQGVSLGGHNLFVGRDTGIADEQRIRDFLPLVTVVTRVAPHGPVRPCRGLQRDSVQAPARTSCVGVLGVRGVAVVVRLAGRRTPPAWATWCRCRAWKRANVVTGDLVTPSRCSVTATPTWWRNRPCPTTS